MALSCDLEVKTKNQKTPKKPKNPKLKFDLLLLFVLAMDVPTA